MGLRGGGFWSRSAFAAAGALLALSACASGPSGTMYDLSAARPPPAHAVGAQFRVGQPTATADLDSDRFLVRDSQTLATLAGARWPQTLPALFRARLVQSFQNAGLARWIDGAAANANYEVDLDIRAFELDASRRKSMSTSPPGSSRLAAGASWRTRFSLCGRRSHQPIQRTWQRRWIRRLRPS